MRKIALLWLLLLTLCQVSAQQRKDSIQILFPESVAAIDADFSVTRMVLDSIAASLELPPNQGLPITLSTPVTPLTDHGTLQDSVRRDRLQSVALFLSNQGIADTLIIIKPDSCNAFRETDGNLSATLSDSSAALSASSASLSDTLVASPAALSPHAVWLTIDGGEWLGTGDYDIYAAHGIPSPADVDALGNDTTLTDTTDIEDAHQDAEPSTDDSDTPIYNKVETPSTSSAPSGTLSDTSGASDTAAPDTPTASSRDKTSPASSAATHAAGTSHVPLAAAPPSRPTQPGRTTQPVKTKQTNKTTNMEQTQDLKDLIARQHDTILELRQQLEEALQSTQSSGDAASSPSVYTWLPLLLLLFLLIFYIVYKRRQYQEATEQLNDQEIQLNQLTHKVARLDDDLQKSKAAATAGTTSVATTATSPVTTATSPATTATSPATTATSPATTPTSAATAPTAEPTAEPAATPTASGQPAESVKSAPTPGPIIFTTTPQAASAEAFDSMYRGKEIYDSLVDGTCQRLDDLSRSDITGLVEYYRLQKRDFVDALDNDYVSLSRNHKLFLILVDMGKSDADIQRLMGITQTTIRSIRFRIKLKRKSGDEPQHLALF